MSKVYYTVVNGDTLEKIANEYHTTTNKLIANNQSIGDGGIIYVGQELLVSGSLTASDIRRQNDSSEMAMFSSRAAKASSKKSSNKPTITDFGLQANTDRTIYAKWTWSKSHVDHYEVKWYYATGDGIWFVGNDSTVTAKQSTYSAPSNATKVKFKCKPVSKTHKVNKKDTKYWTAEWSSEKKYEFKDDPSEKPPAPTVTVKDYTITAKVENIPQFYFGTHIKFQFVRNDNKNVYTSDYIPITKLTVSCVYTGAPGNEYKVRVKGGKVNSKGKCVEDSDWTDYSSAVKTVPKEIESGITELRALSETSVRVDWTGTKTAESYEVQYTTQKRYFDSSNEVSSMTIENVGEGVSHAEVTGLESGTEYFFRVRAVNDVGSSVWTEIKSIIIGKEPSAPTTWSSSTTVVTGKDLTLYWYHNSADNSTQTKAELEFTRVTKDDNGKDVVQTTTFKITGCGQYAIDSAGKISTTKEYTTDDDKTKNCLCTVDTSGYSEGVKIKWRVRTAGITGKYNEENGWSVLRTVDIYAAPYFEIFEITNAEAEQFSTLESFPWYVHAVPGPRTQNPIGFHVKVVANDAYEYTDQIGNTQYVSEGQTVYSKYFETKSDLLFEMMPSEIDLENNVSYTVYCVVSMSSGLTAETHATFVVYWEEEEYIPDAEIHINDENLTAVIRPYCGEYPWVYHKVEYDSINEQYIKTDEVIDELDGEIVEDAFIGDDYVFKSSDGIYFVMTLSEEPNLIEDITLSVYRREYDGKFTELATGINNLAMTFVSDPHPALDYARYRIVAISQSTGAVGYYDVPGEPVGESSIVIQWAETWSEFYTNEEDELEEQPWSGEMLKLPYNIDVSDSNSPDVALVEYIGRENPVSYYGTQKGTKSTWRADIPKNDIDTLYALRRLAVWMGDVYVREPSGSGYWANVNVSFSQTHKELIIPVTLEITRVEGGA